jgi:hypothetical protein
VLDLAVRLELPDGSEGVLIIRLDGVDEQRNGRMHVRIEEILGFLSSKPISVFDEFVKESNKDFGLELKCSLLASDIGGEEEHYLQRIRVPRDTGPGFDDFLASLENVSALNDNLECRLMLIVITLGHLSNNDEGTVLPGIIVTRLKNGNGLNGDL